MILPTKIGLKLSARRKLPVILAYDAEFWPHQFLSTIWRMRTWKRIEETPEYGIYQLGDIQLKLLRIGNSDTKSPSYTGVFFSHWWDYPQRYGPPIRMKLLRTPDKSTKSPSYTGEFFSQLTKWARQYTPPGSLDGKTVLDVGSGCGETTLLWFLFGAKKVIAVDQSPRACGVLEENAEANGWDVVVLCEPFNAEHMKLPFDFAKMDVEGGESCLLNLDVLPSKPMVAEVHSAYLIKEFTSRFGFHHTEILRRDDGIPAYSIMRCNY